MKIKYNKIIEQTEMEYVVTCVKHLFANHVVLQFSVLNTVDDQRLRDVRYRHMHTHSPFPPPIVCAHCLLLPHSPLSSLLYSSLFCCVLRCLVSFLTIQWLLTSSCHAVHIPLHSTQLYSVPSRLPQLNSTLCYITMTHSPLLSSLLSSLL
jgi:Coatomer gamma subunit appendage platform subdomain